MCEHLHLPCQSGADRILKMMNRGYTREQYLRLVEGRPGWEQLFQKYDFGAVLIPRSWPLEALLDRDPGWQRRKADALAVLYQRAREPSFAPPNEIARRDR